MKTIKSDKCQVSGVRTKSAARQASDTMARSPHVSRFTFHVSGFTLIELLVVIAIMATLAALLLPVAGAVKKHQYIYNTQAEMAKLETAIDRYKAAYGFYPPSNHRTQNNQALINQLYYELVGTTNTADPSASPAYQTLDRSLPMSLSGGAVGSDVDNAFGVGGFMNSTKPSGGEDASAAKNFLPDLKPNQIWPQFTNNSVPIRLIKGSVGGPDDGYQPMGTGTLGLNPWRYVCPGTNNPGSYDLWIQLVISGKTNLICNWSKQLQTDSPLP